MIKVRNKSLIRLFFSLHRPLSFPFPRMLFYFCNQSNSNSNTKIRGSQPRKCILRNILFILCPKLFIISDIDFDMHGGGHTHTQKVLRLVNPATFKKYYSICVGKSTEVLFRLHKKIYGSLMILVCCNCR